MLIMTFPILHPLHHLLVNDNVHLVSSVVMLLMARRQASIFIVLFFISQLFRDNASQQCRVFVKNKDRYYMAKGPKRGDRKCKD